LPHSSWRTFDGGRTRIPIRRRSAGPRLPDGRSDGRRAAAGTVDDVRARWSFCRSAGADGIPAILVGGQYRIPRARLEEYAGRSITWPPPPRPRKHRPHRSSRKGASPTAEPAPQAPDQSDELRAPGAADAAPGLKHDLDAEPGRRAGQGLDVGIEAGIGGAAVETAAPAADVRDIEEAPTDGAETRRDDTIDSQQSLPFEG
jgi:hypothetical protein